MVHSAKLVLTVLEPSAEFESNAQNLIVYKVFIYSSIRIALH